MIYLNNAATTYPKPQCVLDAHAAALRAVPSAQYRGALGVYGPDVFEACRESLGRLLHIAHTERIYFSSGATDSFNKLLLGLPPVKGKIITTEAEHNSILRPLYNHPVYGKQLLVLPCEKDGRVDMKQLLEIRKGEAEVLFLNHCSNVTGTVQDMRTICGIAKEKGLLVFADVSQSAGCLPVDADGWGLDGLVFTGHKSLYGVQGTGGYYVREGVGFMPVFFGGTGRDSSRLTYEDGDYEYEPGTQNAPGIAALYAGVEMILKEGVENIAVRERVLLKRLFEGLSPILGVRLFGAADESHGPVMSFTMEGIAPSDIAYILQNGYGILVRTGLHCAPLIHRALGTKPDGTVRVSAGLYTTEAEIDALIGAVKEISASLKI